MRKPLLALSLATLMLSLAPAFAAGNAQQDRMKTCNADAAQKALQGDARKAFMKDCLAAKPAAATNTQQQRMKQCNADAGEKKLAGDARKDFMKKCLSGSAAPASAPK
jgi:hypothetical protein